MHKQEERFAQHDYLCNPIFLRGILLKKLFRFIFSSAVILLPASQAFSWGSQTHKFINEHSVVHLPPSMSLFINNSQFLRDHAPDADTRKSSDPTESPKHFIDIEDYPEYATGTLSHNYDSLVQAHGLSFVTNIGTVPWAAIWSMDSLTAALRRLDTASALQFAADLGHYVADGHQPLHVTSNYDGQKTGNGGIHSRYESSMMNTYLSTITITPTQVHYVEKPIDFVFNYIYGAHVYVDSILAGDTYAKTQSGGSYNAVYYTALWAKTGALTQKQVQDATVDLADLYYTAAVNAGIISPPKEYFAFSVSSLSFGNVLLGSSRVDSFYVANTGSAVLTIDSVKTATTLFAITPASATINPSDSAKFYVLFSPIATESVKDTAFFYDNAGGSPHEIMLDGNGTLTAVGAQLVMPHAFSLSQNYPNPFNPTTQIRFETPVSGFVVLKVFDAIGREVAILVNEQKLPGTYEVQFDGSKFASGVYFYRLQVTKEFFGAGNYTAIKKLTLLR